jgi:hypothetical protein
MGKYIRDDMRGPRAPYIGATCVDWVSIFAILDDYLMSAAVARPASSNPAGAQAQTDMAILPALEKGM